MSSSVLAYHWVIMADRTVGKEKVDQSEMAFKLVALATHQTRRCHDEELDIVDQTQSAVL